MCTVRFFAYIFLLKQDLLLFLLMLELEYLTNTHTHTHTDRCPHVFGHLAQGMPTQFFALKIFVSLLLSFFLIAFFAFLCHRRSFVNI